jgi:hypothetical protein
MVVRLHAQHIAARKQAARGDVLPGSLPISGSAKVGREIRVMVSVTFSEKAVTGVATSPRLCTPA